MKSLRAKSHLAIRLVLVAALTGPMLMVTATNKGVESCQARAGSGCAGIRELSPELCAFRSSTTCEYAT
jgi:hypothetical protein